MLIFIKKKLFYGTVGNANYTCTYIFLYLWLFIYFIIKLHVIHFNVSFYRFCFTEQNEKLLKVKSL